MFFEKNSSFVKRHGWTFPYAGCKLIPLAVRAFNHFVEAEMEARNVIAKLISDPKVSHKDKRIIQADNDIRLYGEHREKCAVWAHEFERMPERIFSLGVNDILFFNGEQTLRIGASQRDKWSFTYKGIELISVFRRKIEFLREQSYLLKHDCEERKEIEEEIEEIRVIFDESSNDPDKEFQLDVGDIVYFDLAPLLRSDS